MGEGDGVRRALGGGEATKQEDGGSGGGGNQTSGVRAGSNRAPTSHEDTTDTGRSETKKGKDFFLEKRNG